MLLKGGQHVTVSTHSFFGRQRKFDVPLDSISCYQGRLSARSKVPLKIKNYSFFFLIDKTGGTFHNERIFDKAIGLQRKLK